MFKGDKRKWTLLLVILVLGFGWIAGCGEKLGTGEEGPPSPSSEMYILLETMNQTADELYRASTTGAYEEARELLKQLSQQAASGQYEGITTAEGAKAFADSVEDALSIYSSESYNNSQAVRAAARLKLATDALNHPNQPMWLHYHRVLTDDTSQLKLAILEGDLEGAVRSYGRLKEHYETIRPAVWISRTPEEGNRMDSLLLFFGKYTQSGSFHQEVLESGLDQWSQALAVLFRKGGAQSAYVPLAAQDQPMLWTVTVGSLIVAVLSFAIWRMIVTDRNSIRPPRYPEGF